MLCVADMIGPDRVQATPTALRTAQPALIQPRSLCCLGGTAHPLDPAIPPGKLVTCGALGTA
jgi:hypothetical protein